MKPLIINYLFKKRKVRSEIIEYGDSEIDQEYYDGEVELIGEHIDMLETNEKKITININYIKYIVYEIEVFNEDERKYILVNYHMKKEDEK